MKRTYCDCCGKEMDYNAADVKAFTTEQHTRVRGEVGEISINVLLNVVPANIAPGKHRDLCAMCRSKAVAQVAEHLVLEEKTSNVAARILNDAPDDDIGQKPFGSTRYNY